MDDERAAVENADYYPSRTIRELIELIGYTMTSQLCSSFGGRQIPIPINSREAHPLALTIGLGGAELLSKKYGGTALDIPLETTVVRQRRDKYLTERYESSDDISIASLASEIGLSRKMVSSIIKKTGHMVRSRRERRLGG